MNDMICMLAAVLIHELGHLSAAYLLGIKKFTFALKYYGGIFFFDFTSISYFREFFIHIAGGLANILTSYAAYIFFSDTAYTFIGISIFLAVINFLPISGFDGGGALKAVLCIFLYPEQVYFLTNTVSYICILFLCIIVIWIEFKLQANLGILFFMLAVLLTKLK